MTAGLTAAAFSGILVDVDCGVRTSFYPQASGAPANKATQTKILLYGDNGLGAGAFSHPLSSDKRIFHYTDGRRKVITPCYRPNQ